MRILFLTLMMSFLSHSAFASEDGGAGASGAEEVGTDQDEQALSLRAELLFHEFNGFFKKESDPIFQLFGLDKKRPTYEYLLNQSLLARVDLPLVSEKMFWIGQQEAALLTPEFSEEYIFTTGCFPCYSISIFNHAKPGYVAMIHCDELFDFTSLGHVMSQLSSDDESENNFEINLVINQERTGGDEYQIRHACTQEELVTKIEIELKKLEVSKLCIHMIPYEIEPTLLKVFQKIIASLDSYRGELKGFDSSQALQIYRDYLHTRVVNKNTGKLMHTSPFITRLLEPSSEMDLDTLREQREKIHKKLKDMPSSPYSAKDAFDFTKKRISSSKKVFELKPD